MALFGTNEEQAMTTQPSGSSPGHINMIGEGTVVDGTLTAEHDIRISGSIVGTVRVEGRVIVAEEGTVDGELVATNADIAGQVQGDIQVEEQLVLRDSAQVEGGVETARLVVEAGASFNGDCTMGHNRTEAPSAPASKPKTIPAATQRNKDQTNSATAQAD